MRPVLEAEVLVLDDLGVRKNVGVGEETLGS